MNREDDQQLWDLLGNHSTPAVSPFFARNVLREVRQSTTRGSSVGRWFGLRRLIPVSAVAAVILASVGYLGLPHSHQSRHRDAKSVAAVDAQDSDLLVDLDDSFPSDDVDGSDDDDDVLTL